MLDATKSGCINHPGIEAIGRCKQCGAPFCHTCEIHSVYGRFCSTVCKEKYDQFVQRAEAMDKRVVKPGFFYRLKKFVLKLVALVIALAFIAFLCAMFNVPVAGPIAARLFQMLGIPLPF